MRTSLRFYEMPTVTMVGWLCTATLIAAVGSAAAQDRDAGGGASSTATGVSRAMNPAISVNVLALGETSRDAETKEANQIDLQELEMRLTSVVDPFWTADATLAVHPAHAGEEHAEAEVGAEHAHGGRSYEFDVETAEMTYRNMPRGLALRLGKFYLPFGRHLPLHTHQFPFVRAPIGLTAFVGDHGLTEIGAEVGATVPLLPWWSDLQVYAVDARSEIFDAESRDLTFGARWSNLWDLSDETTLELGASGLTGPAARHEDDPGFDQRLLGADVTVKWISSDVSQGPAVNVTAEVLLPRPEEKVGDPFGVYALAQFRFARSWWLGVGGSVAADVPVHEVASGAKQEEEGLLGLHRLNEVKGNISWTPSEFSAVRAEVAYLEDLGGDYQDLRFLLQVNVTIGSHPAHLY